MKVLSFDTSSKALSVAVLDGESVLAETTINITKNHSVSLMPVIDFLMESVGLLPQDLDRIVVAEGPGSYTGLRVAVATAKTLAYTLGIELVGISSLYSLTDCGKSGDLLVPIIDARRQHVYVGFYRDGKAIKADTYMAFSDVLSSLKDEKHIHFVGEVDSFLKQIKTVFPTARITATLPSATLIGRFGAQLLPVDVEAFVPKYLKRVEAEENWLKNHNEPENKTYVKRV
ncbi:tRNA (adenosine(37)-N6)-threonylcarbamoyltransferase complex dimerization subunit type 1 TsaB [Streptococcus sciuri]|uniref:tRNA (Adenosine(37)-N6)-threonylcarbamoyltransferase complex dimerization subunit type 1 TsaB n=1 Tax=Streptococcus sciuri TaxID=2973939 RepID=A0ABT2F9H9_9STRE|nr:tRNA (adenosine(37)-N6)-threonylcarbamoyltransferase complex dimerization subunit type 1 TsaB [Streptococcus sciuri]MCS4488475.1 tRNA (adenosine(37)-N6)-threonylcarbamoyltransferase complex dimerization subunit type 1 TsaB [Streptococcus sciuri]